MPEFRYTRLAKNDKERLIEEFCRRHGDEPNGIIADEEYDRLFDHAASILTRYGTFSEDVGPADFKGSRYVDQIPCISIVRGDSITPSLSVQAALEIVSTAHRPVTVEFDYYPDELVVLPPANVFSTFSEAKLNEK